MVIPRDTMTMENFNRAERGLPPIRREVVTIPEPAAPVVENELKIEDIPTLEISDFSARSRTVRNEDGIRFTGFDVYIKFADESEVQGWVAEGSFQQLKARIPRERIDLLQKIVS